jgi:hypothetical protein
VFHRLTLLRKTVVVLAAAAMSVAALHLAAPAAAQERVERKSILQLLFGGGNSAKTEAPKPERTSRVRRSEPRAAAPPPEPVVEKLENARRILLVGDFLAGGTADGLSAAFAQAPGVIVVDRSNGSSGLVRNDYYDWPGEARGIVEEIQPSIIVVQLGSNDRQQLAGRWREAKRCALRNGWLSTNAGHGNSSRVSKGGKRSSCSGLAFPPSSQRL